MGQTASFQSISGRGVPALVVIPVVSIIGIIVAGPAWRPGRDSGPLAGRKAQPVAIFVL